VTWAGGGLEEADMAGMWDEAVMTPPFCGWEGGGPPPPATWTIKLMVEAHMVVGLRNQQGSVAYG